MLLYNNPCELLLVVVFGFVYIRILSFAFVGSASLSHITCTVSVTICINNSNCYCQHQHTTFFSFDKKGGGRKKGRLVCVHSKTSKIIAFARTNHSTTTAATAAWKTKNKTVLLWTPLSLPMTLHLKLLKTTQMTTWRMMKRKRKRRKRKFENLLLMAVTYVH